MEKIINSRKYILFIAVLALVSLFSFTGLTAKVANASVNTSTSGSVIMNYDYNGGTDPDCVALPTASKPAKLFGDGHNPDGQASGQFTFCLNAVVKYVSGLTDISGLNITYVEVAKQHSTITFAGESNGTYRTYQVSYTAKASTCTSCGSCFTNSNSCQALTGSCSVSPSSVTAGGTLNWSASASGGTGGYTYTWSGTDSLSDTGRLISKIYSNPGTKTGTVTITSGTKSITKTCTATIVAIPDETLTGSCLANPSSVEVGNSISWSASAGGGSGAYSYTWSGTNSLSGNGSSISKNYSTAGSKTGTVTITSGNQSVTRNCNAVVTAPVVITPADQTLTGSCSVNPNSIVTGNSVLWNSSASGGNGYYTYSWSGTDGLNAATRGVTMYYYAAGSKTGTVTITSGNQSVTRTCSAVVTASVVITPADQTLTGSCSVSPASTITGNSISWSASASGGTGGYTYSWNGTDSLSGTGSFVSKTYNTAGTKTGTVIISSGNQSVTRTCSAVIIAPTDQTLTGSCSVSPSSVAIGGYLNWSASASGGTGSYTYSWSGTNSLSGTGSSLSKNYSTAGTKTGTVIVSSGDQSVTRTCSAVVNETVVVDDDLSVYCTASQSTVDIDENITWKAYASGGDGSYSYDWSGTDSLNGSSRNLTWNYNDSGTKRATITVDSNGQSASASCTTRVNVEKSNSNNDNLSVSCYANPSTTQTNARMNWYVNVSGGDGDYDYDWSGTDGLNSSSRSPYMTYSTTGSKSARITVRDGNGDQDSDTCYASVNAVLAYTQTYQAPIAPAVYLSQVPSTGIYDNYKLSFFVGVLALFSAWIAYIVISYKKNKEVIQ